MYLKRKIEVKYFQQCTYLKQILTIIKAIWKNVLFHDKFRLKLKKKSKLVFWAFYIDFQGSSSLLFYDSFDSINFHQFCFWRNENLIKTCSLNCTLDSTVFCLNIDDAIVWYPRVNWNIRRCHLGTKFASLTSTIKFNSLNEFIKYPVVTCNPLKMYNRNPLDNKRRKPSKIQ